MRLKGTVQEERLGDKVREVVPKLQLLTLKLSAAET